MAGLTRYEKDKERFTASMIGLITALSVFSVIVYTSITSQISFDSKYVYALLVEILFSAYFNFWAAYIRNNYEYIRLFCMTLFHSISTIMVTTIFPMLSPQNVRLDVRIYSEVVIWVLTGIICLIMIIRKNCAFYCRDYWIFALKQNVPLIPHYLSATILNQSDRVMIGMYCGKTKTAFYNLAYTISFMMLVITNAVKSSLDPYFYQVIKKGEGVEQLSKRINQLFFIVIFLCVVSIAIAPELILVFAPVDYYEARYVIPPLAVSVFFIFAYNVFSCVEFYYGKTKEIMLISSLGAFVNVGLNFILIPVFGYIIASYTTLISYIIFALGHFRVSWRLAKNHGLEKIYKIKRILLLFVLVLIIMGVFVCLYDYITVRYFVLIFFLIFIVKGKYFLKFHL